MALSNAHVIGLPFFSSSDFLTILSVTVLDINAEQVPTTINRVMDYTDLLNTNSEDMTTKSEDLSSTYVSGRKVSKTILKQPNSRKDSRR